jgi:serine/threonine protein kinase
MPTHQELPEVFGRYRILKKLGAGGMGTVFLAEDTRMRRKVALKVPHFTPGTRAAGLERFQREARLAGSIDHPNFCPVHDVDEVDGIHFFTMTYLEGTPLSELLADEQPWPPQQAVELVWQVALAVGELHRRGIVHRDLKPANIMVRPSGEPVLMDFGLACSLTSRSERLTGTGEILGTLAYMPPEQLEGDRARLGAAADVYSLGMILYELLTGQLPFSGPPLLVVAQVGNKVPAPPSTRQPGLDVRLDTICLTALAKKPEERFPDTSAFVAALAQFLSRPSGDRRAVPAIAQSRPGPRPSRRETIPPSNQETARRRFQQPSPAGRRGPLLLLTLMVVVTGLVLTSAFTFWRPRDEDTPDAKPPDKKGVQKQPNEPPPRPSSLRLETLGPVRLKAGEKKTVPVKVRRENYAGPVQVVAAAASPSVTVHGQVDEGAEEGYLELTVAADAKPGNRLLRLRAFALAGSARAEGDLSLTIQVADSPPPKPSLLLEELAAVRVETGQTRTVPVKIQRRHCPGPVQVELAETLPGISVRNGWVPDGSEAGTLDLVVSELATPGKRRVKLRVIGGAARAAGQLPLTVVSAPVRSENKSKTPAFIVHVQSLDAILRDARYLATLTGGEEQAKQFEAALKQFTGVKGRQGVDTKRPMGLYGFLARDLINSQAVALLPIADEEAFLGLLNLYDLKHEKDKDGIYTVQPPQPNIPFYFRFANKYLYLTARDKNLLDEKRLLTPAAVLPAETVDTVSATLNLDSLPKEIRDLLLGQLEIRLVDLKKKQALETDAQHAVRVKAFDEISSTLTSLLQESGRLTVQLKIDPQGNDLSLSVSLAGRSGTVLANTIKALGDTESALGGLIGSDSAMSARLTITLPDAIRKAMGPTIDEAVKTMFAQVENAPARALAERFAKALVPTIEEGTLDVAFDLRGPSDDNRYTALLAVCLKDTADLDQTLRASVEKLPENERKRIQLDAERVGNAKIHRLDVREQLNAQAKEQFGENPVYLAYRDDALFLAVGEKGRKAVQDAIKEKSKVVPLLNVEIALSRLVPLMDRTKAANAAAKAFGKDKDDDKLYLILTGGRALSLRVGIKGPVIRFFSLFGKGER